jgi:hypothetical protein
MIKAYLGGAVEKAPDRGVKWREDMSEWMKTVNILPINPLDFDNNIAENYGLADPKEVAVINVNERFQRRCDFMREIVTLDINAVIDSDILVVHMDEYTLAGAGTFGEMTVAWQKTIPVVVWVTGKLSLDDLPGWALGTANFITESQKQFRDYLKILARILFLETSLSKGK